MGGVRWWVGSQAPPATPTQWEEPTSPLSERSRLPTALTPPQQFPQHPGPRRAELERWPQGEGVGGAPPPREKPLPL